MKTEESKPLQDSNDSRFSGGLPAVPPGETHELLREILLSMERRD